MITGLFYGEEERLVKNHINKLTKGTVPFMHVEHDKVGGEMSLECDIFIAAFNHLDSESFVNNIKGLKNILEPYTWEDTQIMIMRDNDDIWKIVKAEELSEYDL